MTQHTAHERFTSANSGILAHDVWAEDGPEACRVCGAALEGVILRCPECAAIVPVCVGACGACVSPICVGGA